MQDGVDASQGADCVSAGGSSLVGEGGEIVGAGEEGGSLFEGLAVKKAEDVVAVESDKGIHHGIEVEVVVVDFSGGAVAGMEVCCNGFYLDNADVGGEKRVEGKEQAGVFLVAVKVGGLPEGVNAGVCSP